MSGYVETNELILKILIRAKIRKTFFNETPLLNYIKKYYTVIFKTIPICQ